MKQRLVLIVIIAFTFFLALNVSYSAKTVIGTTANLSTWDNTIQFADINESIRFYANYTNSSGLIPGAQCNITFNGTTQTMSESSSYEYNKSFPTFGNKTYSINCTSAGFDSLNITDWIYINPEITTNINIWDSSTNKTEYENTQLSFYANYTNTTGAANQFISGAVCNISFSDSQSAIMTQESSSVYNHTRNFSSLGNYTYTVNCTAAGLPSAKDSSWILIEEKPLQAPTLFWNTGTTQVYDPTLNLYGYIGQPNIIITANVQDFNETLNNPTSTTSVGVSNLIGTYNVKISRFLGNTQITLNGTDDTDLIQEYHYIKFSNHNNTNFLRYDIINITPSGSNEKSIIINGSFSSDIPAGTTARVYDSLYPSGYFNITLQLFENITNYIKVWGVNSNGTDGLESNFSVYYNTSEPQVQLSGVVVDDGITTYIETLSFSWPNATTSDNYEIAIGTTPYPNNGFDNLLLWQSTSNQTNYSQTFDLTIDTAYYASVRAVSAGIYSDVIVSNGVMYVDVTAPKCLPGGSCVKIQGQGNWTNDPQLYGYWNFTENESSISHYIVEVGTDTCYMTNSSSVEGPIQTTVPYRYSTISTPVDNESYYFNVWAVNTEKYEENTSQCYSSQPIKFDNNDPISGWLNYTGGKYTIPTIDIYYDTGTDLHSGIKNAELWQKTTSLNSVTGSCDSFPATTYVKDLSLGNTSTQVILTNGNCYVFEMRVNDFAANQKVHTNGGILYNVSVDITAPPSVIISDAGFITNGRDLSFTWTESVDGESGLKGYHYRLYQGYDNGTYKNYTKINDSFTQQTSVFLENLGLEHNEFYFLEVYAIDNFDQQSTATTSDGIIFNDNVPPNTLEILSIHTDTTTPYFILTNESNVNISVYGEPSETCLVSLNDIDFLGFADPLVKDTFVTDAKGYANFSINYSIVEGENTYYVVCRDKNDKRQNRYQNTHITFTIDTQGPTISVVTPSNGSTDTGIVNFRIDVNDYFGIKSAIYKVLNASNTSQQPKVDGVLFEGQNIFSSNFLDVETSQDFYIVINATDMNNKSSNLMTLFTVDNTIPKADYDNSKKYYNSDFTLNMTFQMFTNYTIIIAENLTTKYYEYNTSPSPRTIVNKIVDINASSDPPSWSQANYSVYIEAVNVFDISDIKTSWFVIDTMAPGYYDRTLSPNPVYGDTDLTLLINWSDENLDAVILEHDAVNGTPVNHSLNSTSERYSYVISSSNLTTNEVVTYKWYASDLANNTRQTLTYQLTVQNRVPYFILPGLSFNNTKILNKEDYYQQILAYDTEGDNLTYKIQGAGQNITASIINYSDSSRNYTVLKISPDNDYIGASWIMFNVTDSYGAINQTINFTLNITNSTTGQTINTNSSLLIDFSYWQNVSMPLIQNLSGYYPSYESSFQTALSTNYNTSITNLLIEPNQTMPRIIIENLNLSKYPTLNVSYQPYNLSLFNNSQFLGGIYTLYDAFIFEIDNNTYNGTYTVFWNYPKFNITDYNASNFLYIYKLDINSSTLNITYSSSALASSITVNSSYGYIWGTYSDFSLFVLAHLKPTSEGSSCDGVDNDQDGLIDENINCNPGSGGGSGSSGGSSGGSGGSSGFSSGTIVDSCENGELNTGELGPDCDGVCSGHWYDNSCHASPQNSCEDGVQNWDEDGVDCGGSCPNVCLDTQQPTTVATCFDGVQNQAEFGIDCGGPCRKSCETCFDGVKNQGEEGKDCEGPCSQDCSILTKSINIFTGGGLIPIISFALAALIILGAAIGFVLVRKHGGHEYYKAPTQQTPAELAEGLPTVPEGELPAVPQQKHEEEDEIIKIEPKELPEFDVQNSDLDYLIKYVNVEQAKGVLNSSIRVALMRAKWPTQMIDESFERTECTRKLVELDKYIKKARKAGQDDDSIRHKLLSAKWAEHFIDMVMHEVHVLHDDFDKIKAYANSLFSKGYSKKDILKTLTDVGWSKADVKLYIEE